GRHPPGAGPGPVGLAQRADRAGTLRRVPHVTGRTRMADARVLLVTGASRGIGAATATLAAMRGYTVVLNYRRDAEAAESVAEAIRAQGGHALALQADVSDPAQVAALFERIDAQIGRASCRERA